MRGTTSTPDRRRRANAMDDAALPLIVDNAAARAEAQISLVDAAIARHADTIAEALSLREGDEAGDGFVVIDGCEATRPATHDRGCHTPSRNRRPNRSRVNRV
jgi:hypothetical protein